MQIVKPYAKILNVKDREEGIQMLKRIEYFTRISHRSEDAITEDSYDRLLRSVVMQHGDLSVIEHEVVNVEAVVDRGITHEWVRHRIGSYTQESTRFVNYGKKGGEISVIEPPLKGPNYGMWIHTVQVAEEYYLKLLSNGESPQIARAVLPNCLASKLIATYNLRSWRHFFIMRTCKEAHPQLKQVTIPLLEEFKAKIPILFEDIEPEQRQAEALKKYLR